jgi:tRNA modification GTPase
MPRSYLDPPLPILALATPPGKSALAVLRASGPGCIELLATRFSRPAELVEATGHSLVFGEIREAHSGEGIDEVLVAVFRAPRSPTGEDQVEVSCHGSPAVVRRLLVCLEGAGFAPALPGEFSFRAFVGGKTDLVRAEAVDEIVSARSEGARAEALKRLEGGLSRRLEAARKHLLGLLAEAEVRLDYAEEDGSPASLFPRPALLDLRRDLAGLASTWRAGRIYGEGARVVLAGRTNAGKSSLFNLLLREERALVSPEPGTTRDWIEAGIEIAGFPLRLIDTAGLREESGRIEGRGIEKSRTLVGEADLVICLVDATGGIGKEDEELLARRPEALRVWNKVDLAEARPCPAGWIPVSSLSGAGFANLVAGMEAALRSLAGISEGPAAEDEFVIANERQRALLERATTALDEALAVLDAAEARQGRDELLDAATLELRDAADALGEITGEISSPEVLKMIFSGFCLGK